MAARAGGRGAPGPDFSLERAAAARLGAGARLVCGVDEAGRGPWAGPVVAAAAAFPDPAAAPEGLNDSKKLTPARRAALLAALRERALIGVGVASVEEIDRLNILRATWLAMRRAVAALPRAPDFALIDGKHVPDGLPCPSEAVVKGDARSISIAAASIAAKETRDEIMRALARAHPGYGWERNMGYGVPAHREALKRLGVTQHHRRSFAPIHKILLQD
ncbi:ribonuclease HII [Oceanicella actignis]|uniref:Ribonuclease HII n=1 Tax=Oceanicella actignis TaxID=1189325 RepID=A0A1M7TRS0_9RHOB|nr:ribonuclease HII [Oceanicella actignis]SET77832.1 RNase HII [Oceanicella actignis]SHN73380.1 RNase HII [Oceanicella actignis]